MAIQITSGGFAFVAETETTSRSLLALTDHPLGTHVELKVNDEDGSLIYVSPWGTEHVLHNPSTGG
jgi:hypothetical protein